jgi:hypothetical protein
MSIMAGNRQETLDRCRRSKPESRLHTVWMNYNRQLCGQEELAMKSWAELATFEPEMARWARNPLNLFLGRVTIDDLISEHVKPANSRFWEGHTRFCVAAKYLVRGDVENAETHFEACVRANCWSTDFHHAAVGLLDRIREPDDWPAMLRREDQTSVDQ